MPAVAARDRERHDDPVTDLEILHAAADLDDLAHELVPEDVALLHRRHEAVVEVQVRTADGRRRDSDDRVVTVQDLRVRDVLDLDVAGAHPAHSLHDSSPPAPAVTATRSSSSGCAGCW